jgi:hypothetical protein
MALSLNIMDANAGLGIGVSGANWGFGIAP